MADAASFISKLFTAALPGVKKLSDWAANEAERRDLLGRAGRQYAKRMEERYNTMKVLGMHEAIPLRDIYVRVNLLEKIQARIPSNINKLEEHFRRDVRRMGSMADTKAGIEAVTSVPRLFILGKPGAGKTTFLKRLIFHALDGDLPDAL